LGEDRIQDALETAAEVAEKTGGLGTPGRPVNRRSPFMIGLTGALGVAVAYGLIELFIRARSVLIIIGLAMFIAAGLAEDYLIVPRIMGRTVELPAIVSLVAVLIGGVLLGIVGALVAIRSRPPSGRCCGRSRSAGSTGADRAG
jgi:UDP-N-acetylmuramyl pentapeptide phosphotransferase/UDP-N-acetylglucosamine-1-phosphate transferase